LKRNLSVIEFEFEATVFVGKALSVTRRKARIIVTVIEEKSAKTPDMDGVSLSEITNQVLLRLKSDISNGQPTEGLADTTIAKGTKKAFPLPSFI